MSKYQAISHEPLMSSDILNNRTQQIDSYLNKVKVIYDNYRLDNLMQNNKYQYVSIGKVDDAIFKVVLEEIDDFFKSKNLFYLIKFNDFTFLHIISCGCATISSEIKISIPNQEQYMNKLYRQISAGQRDEMIAFSYAIEYDPDRDFYLVHNYKLALSSLGYRIYFNHNTIQIEV